MQHLRGKNLNGFLLSVCRPRNYHATPMFLLGRKGGDSAFDAEPRAYSKKQLQRKAIALKKKRELKDHAKDKLKAGAMERNMDSDSTLKYIENLTSSIESSLGDIMRPDGYFSEAKETPLDHLPPVPYTEVLEMFRTRAASRNDGVDARLLVAGGGGKGNTTQWLDLGASGIQDQFSSAAANQAASSNALISSDTAEEIETRTYVVHRAFRQMHEANLRYEMHELLHLMNGEYARGLILAPSLDCYWMLMKSYNVRKDYAGAERVFDSCMHVESLIPSVPMWEALVDAKVRREEDVDAALALIDRIKQQGIRPTPPMYNSVLAVMIYSRDSTLQERTSKLWVKMHSEGVDLDAEGFHLMLDYCGKTKQAERAFFLYDEMKAHEVKPTTKIMAALVRASGEAPQHVNGYEDYVFDALAAIEGAEMIPNESIYNAVIYAFSRPGDAYAAEYYFWEMKRKGLTPGVATYNNLMAAYSRSQAVGLKHYGIQGRFVRKEEIISQDDQDIRTLGPERMAKIISESTWSEQDDVKGRGSIRRKKVKYQDDHDGAEGFDQETVMRRVREELRELNLPLAPENGNKKYNNPDGINYLSRQKMLEEKNKKRLLEAEESSASDTLSFPSGKYVNDSGKVVTSKTRDRPGTVRDSWGPSANVSRAKAKAASDADVQKLMEDYEATGDFVPFGGDKALANAAAESGDGDNEKSPMQQQLDFNQLASDEGTLRELMDEMGDQEKSEFNDILKELGMADVDTLKQSIQPRAASQGSDPVASAQVPDVDFNSLLNKDDSKDQNIVVEKSDEEVAAMSEKELQQYINEMMAREKGDGEASDEEDGSVDDGSDDVELLEEDEFSGNKLGSVMKAPLLTFSMNSTFEPLSGCGEGLVHTSKPVITRTADDATSSATALARMLDGFFSDTPNATQDVMKQLRSNDQEHGKQLEEDTKTAADYEWDMIEFGRAPPQDYSRLLYDKRDHNISRAEQAFVDMQQQGLKPDVSLLNSFLSVYGEGCEEEKALNLFHSFGEFGITPNPRTYRVLLKMYIRRKELDKILATFAESKAVGIIPDAETYGLLVQTLTKRMMTVEALKVLEDAGKNNVKILDYYIRALRSRCEKLGMKHPLIPADPNEWVKTMKKTRINQKNTSQSKIQGVRSKFFS